MEKKKEWEENEEIKYFRRYLQIESVHPNVNYGPCVKFLQEQATDLQLPINVHYPKDQENPVVVITWVGTNPELPSILLNSHMDVVAACEVYWTHPPFGAEMDDEGKIFARGSQDMKSVGMQYLGAVRALKKENKSFKRTVHIIFVSDEELGGERGMKPFVRTDEFKKLNVGFSLDKGMAASGEEFDVFYAERSSWRVFYNIIGPTGHGSFFHKNTAAEKFQYIVNKMNGLRAEQTLRLEKDPNLTVGDVTTIDLTRLSGGIITTVIPNIIVIGFDIHLAIDVSHDVFEKQMLQWCEEAGGNITIEYETKSNYVKPTKTDESNPYFIAFKNAIDEFGAKIKLRVHPSATDNRFIRELGIPTLGFSPINNTPVRCHNNDEYLKAETFLKGIEIYKAIITSLANI